MWKKRTPVRREELKCKNNKKCNLKYGAERQRTSRSPVFACLYAAKTEDMPANFYYYDMDGDMFSAEDDKTHTTRFVMPRRKRASAAWLHYHMLCALD